MCGIGVAIESVDNDATEGCSFSGDLLQRRGPDFSQKMSYCSLNDRVRVSMHATVLHVRGTTMTQQPVQLSSVDGQETSLFCWNGEAYEVLHDAKKNNVIFAREVSSLHNNDDVSDTSVISNLLQQALDDPDSHAWVWQHQSSPSSLQYERTVQLPHNNKSLQQQQEESYPTTTQQLAAVAAVISRVWNGEFAFCLVTPQTLYYGRDVWGRRSLLVSSSPCGSCDDGEQQKIPCCCWQLMSVAPDTGSASSSSWTEVPPGKVYEMNLCTGRIQSMTLPKHCPTPTDSPMQNDIILPPPPPQVSKSMWEASFRLQHLLTKAVERRVITCTRSETTATDAARIGILFSGGLDSVVLAALTSSVLVPPEEPIDLLNVCFGSNNNNSIAADRKAALTSYKELLQLYPTRPWRLVCVSVEEWSHVLKEEVHIQRLIHPKHTVMDLNIGTALWFASRGIGELWKPEKEEAQTPSYYSSTCRVLLVGMGADEQMAGYGRHRVSYHKHGYGGLQHELQRDLERLWERNLGRDDRILSDHGREARFPYLDVNVTEFLKSLHLQDKCNLELEPGVGDKQILRLVAHRLGLRTAGGLVKRAIQFGSRMAHMSDKQRFGSRRQASGEARVMP